MFKAQAHAPDFEPEYLSILGELVKIIFLPALTITKKNDDIVQELWEIVKIFDFPTRYSFYHEWYTKGCQANSKTVQYMCQSEKETLNFFKRIGALEKK